MQQLPQDCAFFGKFTMQPCKQFRLCWRDLSGAKMVHDLECRVGTRQVIR